MAFLPAVVECCESRLQSYCPSEGESAKSWQRWAGVAPRTAWTKSTVGRSSASVLPLCLGCPLCLFFSTSVKKVNTLLGWQCCQAPSAWADHLAHCQVNIKHWDGSRSWGKGRFSFHTSTDTENSLMDSQQPKTNCVLKIFLFPYPFTKLKNNLRFKSDH